LLQRRGRGEATTSVGDEDIHRAKALLDLMTHRLEVVKAGHVAGHCDGLPPSCRMAAATSLTAAWSRPWTATAAPRLASSLTIASPIPRELPVTSAAWPSSLLMPHSFQLRGGYRPVRAEIAVAASLSWRPRGSLWFRGAAGPSRTVGWLVSRRGRPGRAGGAVRGRRRCRSRRSCPA